MKESLKVLQECAEMQTKKSKDYQNDESAVLQAMHYRRGIDTIHDIIIGKVMRATSLLESGNNPNFESLEDSYKDLINYRDKDLPRALLKRQKRLRKHLSFRYY